VWVLLVMLVWSALAVPAPAATRHDEGFAKLQP